MFTLSHTESYFLFDITDVHTYVQTPDRKRPIDIADENTQKKYILQMSNRQLHDVRVLSWWVYRAVM